MRKQPDGIYAPYIKEYIEFKRSLGFKYDTEAKMFHFFDRFTIMRDEKIIGITKDLAVDWCNLNPNESGSYKYHRCVCLNQLASYLCKIGFPSYIMQLPANKNTFTPYIFSRNQIADLFKAADIVTGKKKEWTAQL
jgi:integrase/recombinase XerD